MLGVGREGIYHLKEAERVFLEKTLSKITESFPEHPGWKPVRCPQIHADSPSRSKEGYGKEQDQTLGSEPHSFPSGARAIQP